MKNFETSEQILRTRLQPLRPLSITIIDQSEDHVGHREAETGVHVQLEIISEKFNQMSLLKRHQMIYDAIGDLAAAGVHALSIKAFAPTEYSAH